MNKVASGAHQQEQLQKIVEGLATGGVGTQQAAVDHTLLEAELERERSTHRQALRLLEDDLDGRTSKVRMLERTVEELEHELQSAKKETEAVRTDLTGRDARIVELQTRLDAARVEVDAIKASMHATKTEMDGLRSVVAVKDATIGEMSSKIVCANAAADHLRGEVTQLTAQLDTVQEQLSSVTIAKESHEETIARLTAHTAKLEQEVKAGELLRRKLHNDVLELKGNIRVFGRIRPLLDSEVVSKRATYSVVEGTDDRHLSVSVPTVGVSGKESTKTYNFDYDRFFGPDADQASVFSEVAHVIQSALDGYHVCIFAYGQSGSGKTYTMEGQHGNDTNAGIIPRALNQIFETAAHLAERGWSYNFAVQYIEIYNETVRDLLGDGAKDLDVKLHPQTKKPHVPGAKRVPISNGDEARALLTEASSRREVAATGMNDRSSRSHTVFTLCISGTNDDTGNTCKGVLNLVDLAGSERIESSNVRGKRLQETKHINTSLSSLSDVITALSKGLKHVPYRNSKLTYLLRDSLGGSAKALMIVNLSPVYDHLQETVCSLRFGSKVNNCVIGSAQKKAT